MQVFKQGEEYEEEEFDEELLEDEADEDTEAKVTSLYGIPIKTVAVIGAAVLVVLLIGILFATRKSKSSEEIDYLDQPVEDDYVEDYVPVDSESDTVSDTTSGTGDMVYNPDTGLWEEVGAGDSDTVVEEQSATDDERLKLRAMGYSGDEIDYSLRNGFSVQDLIDASQALYDEEADKALRRMSDSASEEFRYIIDNTYFSQTGYVFEPVKDKVFGTYDYEQGSYTVNADYVKCPTYGAQLQLKCRVAQDLWLWYTITPDRWETLPDEGNIVLRVSYTKYGVNTYVTSISETDPTLDTIDSSASTIGDIVDDVDGVDSSESGEADVEVPADAGAESETFGQSDAN